MVRIQSYTDISILIGIDNYFEFVHAPRIDDNLFTIESKVGTLIGGTIPCNKPKNTSVTTVLRVASDNNRLDDELKRMWELDHIGIREPTVDTDAIDKFKDSISYSETEAKYTARLPWKDKHPTLPTNRIHSLQRLQSLLSNLRKHPDNLVIYNNLINEQVKLGFIEEVNEEAAIHNDARLHYIPHHSVYKQS